MGHLCQKRRRVESSRPADTDVSSVGPLVPNKPRSVCVGANDPTTSHDMVRWFVPCTNNKIRENIGPLTQTGASIRLLLLTSFWECLVACCF